MYSFVMLLNAKENVREDDIYVSRSLAFQFLSASVISWKKRFLLRRQKMQCRNAYLAKMR